MKSRTVLLFLSAGAIFVDGQQADPPKERDYSSPTGRLIGKWKAEGINASGECQYYGPVDKVTHEGDFVRYRVGKRDRKTKTTAWDEFKFRYKVLNENVAEHRVTVTLTFTDGRSRNESYYIEPNGLSMVSHTVITSALGEDVDKMVFLASLRGPCDLK
jgi:hypothetical protein